jgi:release factor glutamine methyltransferase
MIALDAPVNAALLEALRETFQTRSTAKLRTVAGLPVSDVFRTALSEEFVSRLFPATEDVDFRSWILNIKDWQDSVQDPRTDLTVETSVLHDLWDNFEKKLVAGLQRARIEASIPPYGGVLVYVAALSRCLVIRYSFSGLLPSLETVAVIEEPQSVFDVWPAVEQADANARNALKNFLASGHKLIFHRGVLGHVDRRSEARVFGPSIDTLVMAELLAQQVYEPAALLPSQPTHDDWTPQSVLEIGSGSGFLAAGAVRHLPSLSELFCIDTEFQAITCTEKNLRIARDEPTAAARAEVRLLTGAFDPELLNRRFDLIVCNPPYIPLPPGRSYTESGLPGYLQAVSGLELLSTVVQHAQNLLSPSGRLLVMTSSLSEDTVLNSLPGGIRVTRPLGDIGYEVIFDVEAVLDRADWLTHLLNTGNLVQRDHVYYHSLHPIWITED